MAQFFHGVRAQQRGSSVSTPIVADSGISFAVGTAPVHTAGGKVNDPVLCSSYEEAVAALGYSNDWKKYSLCEVIDSHFKKFKAAPVVFVNVLDPEVKTVVVPAEFPVVDGKALVPMEAIKSTVTVDTYVAGKDYELYYTEDNLVVGVIPGGAIIAGTAKLKIGYSKVTPEAITGENIIGGYDTAAKKSTGLELVDKVFPKFLIVPDLIIAPGWSHTSTVAAAMSAKAENINGLFGGKAIVDADTSAVTAYSDLTAWKKKNNINAENQILCWPMVALGSKVYHLSTQLAGLMAVVDNDNGGCPCESPSNKGLYADRAVLADGTAVELDFTQATAVNATGAVTALNFIGGYVAFGNCNACFPAQTDPKSYFIPESRMFNWVATSVILSYWKKLDGKMNRRLIDSVLDSINYWMNGLSADEKLLGGRVEFIESENPPAQLAAGIIKFHIYMASPSPAQEFDFIVEYDISYVTAALAA